MKNWILRNEKTIIASAFIIPIIIVAIVSISHVTQWYGLSNPLSWALYLSIGVEIAAMSALAAITAKMGKNVYFPFIIVTILQFIGNIFFSYSYINVDSNDFKNWVELVSPLVSIVGIEPTDLIGHKRFLALFSGGMLPIISLSFLHMLIKYTERISEENKTKVEQPVVNNPQVITETEDVVEKKTEVVNDEPNQVTEDVVEKKTEVVNDEPNLVTEETLTIDVPDVIEPIVEEVIEQEEIIQPVVSNEVIEDESPKLKEQTRSEFLEEIYNEIREEENTKIESISEIIEEENTEDIQEQTTEDIQEQTTEEIINEEQKNVEENFTKASITNVKNFPKVKRKGTKFNPPEIKWGT